MNPLYKRKHGVITVAIWNIHTHASNTFESFYNTLTITEFEQRYPSISMCCRWNCVGEMTGNDVNAIDGEEYDINFDSYWCFWWVQVKKHAPSTIFDREYEVCGMVVCVNVFYSLFILHASLESIYRLRLFNANIFRWIQFRHFSEYSSNILDQRFFRMKFSGSFFQRFFNIFVLKHR